MDFSLRPPRIFLNRADYQAVSHYRIMHPAMALRASGRATTIASDRMLESSKLSLLKPDALVLQYVYQDSQLDCLASYSGGDVPITFEMDDQIWAVPDGNAHKDGFPSDMKQRLTRAIKMSNAVCVSTEPLAQAVRADLGARQITVVPNFLTEAFRNSAIAGRRMVRPIRKPSRKPRVGWAGGLSHAGDLAMLVPVIKALSDEVEFVFMGMVPEDVKDLVRAVPAVQMEQYPEALGKLDLDLALAPLADNSFNRCKSNLRVLEYGAGGYRVIATDLEPYRGTPAVLVENHADAWINAIRAGLAVDPGIVTEAEDAIRNWVSTEWSLEDNLHRWLTAWVPKSKPFVQRHLPCDTTEPLVTIGAPVSGLPNFASFKEAHAAYPNATMMYLRTGTRITPQQIMIARQALPGSAAVCGLSNDGDFPKQGVFTPLTFEMCAEITLAALFANEDVSYEVPYAAGPFIMLSATALGRLGLPDETRFKSDLEMAVAEWSSRAAGVFGSTKVVANVFVPTLKDTVHDPAHRARLNEFMQAWSPSLAQTIPAWLKDPMPAYVREQLELIFYRHTYLSPTPADYPEWIQIQRSIATEDFSSYVTLESPPVLISIIMPVYNPPPDALRAAIKSVQEQSYPHWQLCIADDCSTDPAIRRILEQFVGDERIVIWYRGENGHICEASNSAIDLAYGDWMCCLDHDDVLAPHALYTVAVTIQNNPEAVFLYTDSDKITPEGKHAEPLFSPDFNYELLLGQNYVTHLSVYQTVGVRSAGRFRKGLEGSQDWDLTLRYLEHSCWDKGKKRPDSTKIVHIPHVLYHWRQVPGSVATDITAKPYAVQAGVRAVVEHLSRTKQAGMVSPHPIVPIFNMVRYGLETPPKVGVVVLTKNGGHLLNKCLGGLQASAYSNLEVVVVDNGSSDQDTTRLLGQLIKQPGVKVLRRPGKFDFASFNNDAVKLMPTAEVLCFLNDDCHPVEAGWLSDMVAAAIRPGIGAVGARLIYPDGNVQHTGIIWNAHSAPGQSALHAYAGIPVRTPGPFGHAVLMREWAAVTGACMVITRAAFDAVGGFSPEFPIDYNDVDLCLRLREKGYHNVVIPQAVLVHHEGSTKRRTPALNSAARMLADEQRLLDAHPEARDGNVNPNVVYGPYLNQAAPKPADLPWPRILRMPVLIIGGDHDDAMAAFRNGDLPYIAKLNGFHLTFDQPVLTNVGAVDLRYGVDHLTKVLDTLLIGAIVLRTIKGGTLEILDILSVMAKRGRQVTYSPMDAESVCPRQDCTTPLGPCGEVWKYRPAECQGCIDEHGSSVGYVSVPSYRVTWLRFLNAIGMISDNDKAGAEDGIIAASV